MLRLVLAAVFLLKLRFCLAPVLEKFPEFISDNVEGMCRTIRRNRIRDRQRA